MEVKQVYELANAATKEALGETAVLNEDLSNVVDIGTEILNQRAMDNYVRALTDRIARVKPWSRVLSSMAPSVMMESWDFGSVIQKIQCEIPEATENESWQLNDGQSYDPNIFYQPKVSAKYFNSKTTLEVPMSFTQMQVKESFANAEQLNAFLSMLTTSVENSLTIKNDALIQRTINNMTAETFYNLDTSGTYTGKTGNRAVNLLYLYNKASGKSLTADKCMTDPEFIRYAVYTMDLYIPRLAAASTLFNMGGKVRFTPRTELHILMLNQFKSAAKIYLQSDTFNKELVSLPNAEEMPYWQGSGTDYSFNATSSIDVKTADGHTVKASGILAVMFDREALGVTNMNRRVTSSYNPRAEFYTNYSKCDAGYFNDFNENFVVFYVA